MVDKKFTGISIQKSDILIEEDVAKILYRNYNTNNRSLAALDPAERISIFRVRYIPFPVIGESLAGPSRNGIPIVFEAGISFGNVVVTTNEITDIKFSPKKLGVAVAFTPELFSEDAKILALALTYDFNLYASIGIGANFGTLSENAEPYFSFGINQKAFEALIRGVAGIFSN